MTTTPLNHTILWNRIKTSLYALSAVVLAGWVTDALNEDLMFRLITRYFFPQAVADYQHPFNNLTSTLIWGIPLLVGLLLMLIAAIMTVHNLKKRHVYALTKAKKLTGVENIILFSPLEQLEEAIKAYPNVNHFHIIYTDHRQKSAITETLAALLGSKEKAHSLHFIEGTTDLYKLVINLTKLAHRLTDNAIETDKEMAFDLRYTTPMPSAAAMYASLEAPFSLAYPEHGMIYEYDTEYEMAN